MGCGTHLTLSRFFELYYAPLLCWLSKLFILTGFYLLNFFGTYRKTITNIVALIMLLLTAKALTDEVIYSGWSIGSTHMLGYDYEIIHGSNATQYSAGLVELALSGAITWKKFRPRTRSRIYYGAGPWLIMVITPEESGILVTARAVAGREWDLSKDSKWGLELSVNIPLHVQSLWGPKRHLSGIHVFPLPGIFYRRMF